MSTLPLPDTQPAPVIRCRGKRANGRTCNLVLIREPWRTLRLGEDCAERAGIVPSRRHRLRGPSSGAAEALFEINEGGAVGALKYRHKPTEILAMQWTGQNEPELRVFTSGEFEALEECDDDPAATAAVRESTHGTWRLMYTGDYVIKAGDFRDVLPAHKLAADYDLVPADAA